MLLFLAHIVGDFYIQTEKIAARKAESIKWVFLHCLFYWLTVIVVLLSVISENAIIFGTVAAMTHLLIDIMKYFYIVKLQKRADMTITKERNIFFGDQALHLVCLFFISYIFALKIGALNLTVCVATFFRTTGLSEVMLISWTSALLTIHKPANIAIVKMLLIYKPEHKERSGEQDKKAGRFIGTIERIIMLILISIGQYSALGLVLTAKSIARYDRISKEKDFAEYYLLGTLLSTVVVIIVSFIV